NTGIDLRDVAFHDYVDLAVQNQKPNVMIDTVKTFASQVVKAGKFPIAIGGEHSITPGIVSAFPKDIAVLSLDAHLDYREQYEDEPNNHACAMRRITDHLQLRNIAVFGFRSAEREEYEDAGKNHLFSLDAFIIHKQGFDSCLKKTATYLKGKKIYLTMDIDFVDPAYAPGTSTPEPFGFTPLQTLEIIERFAPQLVGFDIVEVCPPYDQGQTSLLAARIIRSILGAVSANNK
ncbi:MAG: agmatinase, partial [Euryarchaeota archaeon]|nr:agmatinase [Euryarchaeota archaeon]